MHSATHTSKNTTDDSLTPPARRLLAANSMVRLADELANAKTTLPWLLGLAGAPVFFTGMLVPLRESLSMLPQLFVSPLIRRSAIRHTWWTGAAVSQAVCLALMPLILLVPDGMLAGWLLVFLLVCFSLSRCFTSITSKDLMGKSVPKATRGRLQGYVNIVSGPFILLVGLLFLNFSADSIAGGHIALLLGGGAALWLIGAWIIGGIGEEPGEKQASGHILADAVTDARELFARKDFRLLVLTRALLLFPILAAPFLATRINELQPQAAMLGILIALNGVGTMVSAWFWGKLADVSSRATLFLSGLLTSLALLVVPALAWLDLFPALLDSVYSYLAVFVILTVGHTGIRIGRKTVAVNMATGNERTRIIATGNTLIGLVLLLTSSTGLLAGQLGLPALLTFFALPGVAGCVTALRLGACIDCKD